MSLQQNPDLQAINKGLQLGSSARFGLAGINPSASSPRGAGAAADPLAGQFKQCADTCSQLADALERQGGDSQSMALDMREYSNKIRRMQIDHQDQIQAAGQPQQGGDTGAMPATMPNVSGGGTL